MVGRAGAGGGARRCSPDGPKFRASDVTGATFGRDFELTDPTGKPRTLADYRGKAVVIFFGYTQCPMSARRRWRSWPRR